MTNYTFTAGDPGQPEDPKDTDLTHDSPHHTLGRGHTQAAPGNHTHRYGDILEIPTAPLDHNHDSQYVNTGAAGDTMGGPLHIGAGHLYFDTAGAQGIYWPDLNRFIYVADGQLRMADSSGNPVPLEVGSPIDGNDAVNAGWAETYLPTLVSGPHGPQHPGYTNVPNGNVPGTGLWLTAKSIPGTWKLTCSCYGYLVSASNANIYTGLHLRWSDGTPGSYRNGVFQQNTRLHCNAAMGSNRNAMTFVALVDNYAGYSLGFQMQASYDGSPSVAQVGLIRMSAEFYPFSYEIGLDEGWTDIP